jgi:hypothetical protein
VLVDELSAQLVGARDHGAARLARAEERVAIDLARDGVVDDVAAFQALVLAPEPGIDPEALDPHDFLLFVAHRAGHIHHVDDHGVRDRLHVFLPGAEAPVVGLGDDDRVLRIVDAARDRAPERFLVGALEVLERVGADAADAGIAVLGRDDAVLALVLDRGQLELFAQDVRELVERHVHFERVVAGVLPGLTRAVVAFAFLPADGIAHVALALTDAAALLVTVDEAGDVDLRDGDADELLALPPDQLPLRDISPEVLSDLAPDDGAETRMILIDLQRHPRR